MKEIGKMAAVGLALLLPAGSCFGGAPDELTSKSEAMARRMSLTEIRQSIQSKRGRILGALSGKLLSRPRGEEAGSGSSISDRVRSSFRKSLRHYEMERARKKRVLFLPPVLHGEGGALYERMTVLTRLYFQKHFPEAIEVDPAAVSSYFSKNVEERRYGYERDFCDDDLQKLAKRFNANTVITMRVLNLRQYRTPDLRPSDTQKFMIEGSVYKLDKARKVFRNATISKIHPSVIDPLDREFNEDSSEIVKRVFSPYISHYMGWSQGVFDQTNGREPR